MRALPMLSLPVAAALALGSLSAPRSLTAQAAPAAPIILDSPTGEVYATEFGPDGTAYVVGDFTQAGAATGGLAAFDSLGALDRTFTNVPGYVRAVTDDDSGGWFVAVDYGGGGDGVRSNIWRISGDGDIDATWLGVAVTGGAVRALDVVDDTLFIGGSFMNVAGSSRTNLAAVNAETAALSTWAPDPNQAVNVITADDSAVYIGGEYSQLGGLPGSPARLGIAALDRVSSALLPWDPGASGHVYALEADGDVVYVAGSFFTLGGQPRTHLGAVKAVATDDSAATTWNPDLNDVAYGLDLDDTTLYVAGRFDYVFTNVITPPRAARSRAAAFRTDTGAVTPWDPNLTGGSALAVQSTAEGVYLGGTFTQVGGQPKLGLALVDRAAGSLQSWDPSPGPQFTLNGAYSEISTIQSAGGRTLTGGSFTHMLTQERRYAAAFDSQGLLTTWDPALSAIGRVIALDDTIAYVGGDFSTVNGAVSRSKAAAFRTDDTGTATSWDPAPDGAVRTIALDDTAAYLGGEFTSLPGSSRSYAAAVRTDDTGSVTAWDPRPNQSVNVIALQDDTAFLGGLFSELDGVLRSNAAAVRIDDTGTLTSWDPAPWGQVNVIEIQGDLAYLGGQFTWVDDGMVYRSGVAAFETAGAGDVMAGFDAGLSCSGFCLFTSALEIVGDTLYIGGDFSGVNLNSGFSGLAAVSTSTGTLKPGWSPSLISPRSHVSPAVRSLSYREHVLYAGGYFTSISLADRSAPYSSFATHLPAFPLPPSAPTGVTATPGDAQASIAWTPGSDGGAPAERVEFALDDTTTVDDSTTDTTSPHTITGLTNGRAYVAYVRLVNSTGPGDWSVAGAAFTPQGSAPTPVPVLPSPPGAPMGVSATPGDASATITWTAPTGDGGSPITGYRVTTIPSSDGCTVTATTCTLTGLTSGTEYVVSVVATNAAGSSEPATTTVTPRGKASIVITGTRSRNDPGLVKILGTVTNLDPATVQPYVRLGRAQEFQPSITTATVGEEGRFRWQRATSKRITVYVEAAGTLSNRVTIPAR